MSTDDKSTQSTDAKAYRPEGIEDAFLTSDEKPDPKQAVAPSLGWRGLARFMWRQLTSMRVALMLLMLLAIAAVPGSLFPQRSQDPAAVEQYLVDNPTLGEWLDRFSFFAVYASPWFAAIYILLFISLVGCILPRIKAHWHDLKSAPPRTPRIFKRFPAQAARTVESGSAQDVAQRAAERLRGPIKFLPLFRTTVGEEKPGVWTVSAERGYLKETGNLIFHVALVGILLSFGAGQLLEYRGQSIVVEGRGFANAQVAYDSFEHGAWFTEDSMAPFTMTLDKFESVFRANDSAAQDFTATVTLTEKNGESRQEDIEVNHPAKQDGAKIYLMGNGHAPTITVRDENGDVTFSGSVPFLAEDDQYTSKGVVKVPDVVSGEQIGLVGYLLPTADFENGGMRSIYPEALNPFLVLDMYEGDLGLDSGIPQNVYRLDTDAMTKVTGTMENPDPLIIGLGQTVDLPNGRGTVEFSEIPRFAAFDLRYDPTLGWLLGSSLAALGGLAISLFTPRRRVWVRATQSGDQVEVALAGLARGDDSGLQGEVDRVAAIFDSHLDLTDQEKLNKKLSRREI
ncbi:cytochrome c biogenesis protein ResB [Timonella senegalensis]|uniref:cytochrome c biogenesis protein ResB n=1 Tax=Timonella senegalensis TaxID=1465825 RepID=UPI002FE385E6